jgi:hypothetical protein
MSGCRVAAGSFGSRLVLAGDAGGLAGEAAMEVSPAANISAFFGCGLPRRVLACDRGPEPAGDARGGTRGRRLGGLPVVSARPPHSEGHAPSQRTR